MPALLAIRRGALGDTILWIPVLRALRQWRPQASLTLAGGEEYARLLARYGVVDAGISAEALELWALGTEGPAADRAHERLQAYEQVVSDLGAAEIPPRLRARVIGIDPVPDEALGPAPAQLLDRLRVALAGVPVPDPTPWLRAVRAPYEPGLVIVHPGAGAPRKCWPLLRWHELVAALRAAGLRVKVALGEVEAARAGGSSRWPPCDERLDRLPLDRLASEVERAAVFVGHDSGPTHLAAALRVPTVAIFGPTEPRVWAPRGEHVVVLGTRTRGAPEVATKDALAAIHDRL